MTRSIWFVALATGAFLCGVSGWTYTVVAPPARSEIGREIPALPVDLVGFRPMKAYADCDWKRPGADPFTGDVMSALAALGIPESIRGRLWRRMVAHESDEIVSATSQRIVGLTSRTLYAPGIAMTYGAEKVCFNTFARFAGDESGRLYVEQGYHVWVPDVCGNVSRLLPWGEARAFYRSERPSVLPGRVDRGAQPYVVLPGPAGLREDEGGYGGSGGPNARGGEAVRTSSSVPEPSTLWLIALVGLVVVGRWILKVLP